MEAASNAMRIRCHMPQSLALRLTKAIDGLRESGAFYDSQPAFPFEKMSTVEIRLGSGAANRFVAILENAAVSRMTACDRIAADLEAHQSTCESVPWWVDTLFCLAVVAAIVCWAAIGLLLTRG